MDATRLSHRGLTLHLSKSQDVWCRRISVTLRDPVVSLSIPHAASPPPLDPPLASGSVDLGASLGVGGSCDNFGMSDIDGDFNMRSPDGMSAIMCVMNQ